MEIKRIGSVPSGKGPADYFTGTVRVDKLIDAPDPARVNGASVTFEPGARTAWHTHPLGQTLDRHLRLWPRAALGRPHRGDPAWGCDLVRAGREALARRGANHGDDAYGHSGEAQRQDRRVDGAGERRAISGIVPLPHQHGTVRLFSSGEGHGPGRQGFQPLQTTPLLPLEDQKCASL